MAKRAMGWRLPILVAIFALASSNKQGSSVPNETKQRFFLVRLRPIAAQLTLGT